MAITDTCRTAWDGSKKAHQPAYDDLIESYRDMLTARAEAVLVAGLVDDGPFASFEQAVLNAPPEPAVSSDQGYEQVTDVEPFYEEVASGDIIIELPSPVPQIASESPAETFEEVEAARVERAKRREEAQPDPPKKKPLRKVAVVVKKAAAKSPAKKPVPKPKVIKKGKK